MLFTLPSVSVEKIRQVFDKYPAISRVILYGSRAVGVSKRGSDIDLCIESSTLSVSELFQIENQLDDLLLPWRIDLSLKNKINNLQLIKEIETKGVVFYP